MVQASLDGILLGILFALIAYGMALQWGVMNIINIAQGELVIMGGYVAYFMYMMGIHPGFGIIVSPIIKTFKLKKLSINFLIIGKEYCFFIFDIIAFCSRDKVELNLFNKFPELKVIPPV